MALGGKNCAHAKALSTFRGWWLCLPAKICSMQSCFRPSATFCYNVCTEFRIKSLPPTHFTFSLSLSLSLIFVCHFLLPTRTHIHTHE